MPTTDPINVVIIHGWSDDYQSMVKYFDQPLKEEGFLPHYINYDSLEDAATLEDIAEGMFQKLCLKEFNSTPVIDLLHQPGRTLRFITHSTGALVVRQMMKQFAWYNDNQGIAARIESITFLAPANFGSPLAHKAPSLLGRIAKGNKNLEDFGEVGIHILESLELASPRQWELADFDLFGGGTMLYGADGIRAFVLTGGAGYGGIRSFINEDGTDGTIVVAGANLNSRKYVLDFVHNKSSIAWHPGQPVIPFKIYPELTHASILEWKNCGTDVVRCLRASAASYNALGTAFEKETAQAYEHSGAKQQFQQFVFRVTDDRGNAVEDYHLQFNIWHRNRDKNQAGTSIVESEHMDEFEEAKSAALDEILRKNAHTHSVSPEYKRFLVVPEDIDTILGDEYVLTISIAAETGDRDIAYNTQEFENYIIYDPKAPVEISLFYPNTTTLIEVKLDRYSTLVTRHSPDLYHPM